MAGFQVYNDSGTTQFDAADAAYGFVGKGTVIAGGTGLPDSEATYFSTAYKDSLPPFDTIAFSCTEVPALGGHLGQPKREGFYTFAGGVGGNGYGYRSINYYLFRSYNGLSPASSGAGLELFNPEGQLTFSTAYRPVAIVAKHPVTNTYLNMSEFRALPPDREYAFIAYGSLGRLGYGDGGGGNTVSYDAIAGARLVDGGYYVEEVRLGGALTGRMWAGPVNGGFLVVDVTGL